MSSQRCEVFSLGRCCGVSHLLSLLSRDMSQFQNALSCIFLWPFLSKQMRENFVAVAALLIAHLSVPWPRNFIHTSRDHRGRWWGCCAWSWLIICFLVKTFFSRCHRNLQYPVSSLSSGLVPELPGRLLVHADYGLSADTRLSVSYRKPDQFSQHVTVCICHSFSGPGPCYRWQLILGPFYMYRLIAENVSGLDVIVSTDLQKGHIKWEIKNKNQV